MKKLLEQSYLMDYWLKKGHGISVEWLKENEPELIQSIDWYKKYAVSQELHDEWYEWAIKEIMKHYKRGRKWAERSFVFPYLNCSPSVKEK